MDQEQLQEIKTKVAWAMIEAEKRNLVSIAKNFNSSITELIESKFSTYDYITFNGDDTIFYAKNVLERSEIKMLNQRHFDQIIRAVNKYIIRWIIDYDSVYEFAEAS